MRPFFVETNFTGPRLGPLSVDSFRWTAESKGTGLGRLGPRGSEAFLIRSGRMALSETKRFTRLLPVSANRG